MIVRITLGMGVEIREIEAIWFLRPSGSTAKDRWAKLEMGYQQATLDALGPPTFVTFHFYDLGRLNFDRFSFALDGGSVWQAGHTNRVFSRIAVRPSIEWYRPGDGSFDRHDLPGLNPDLLNLLEGARSGQMRLHSPDPGGSQTIDFDLSDRAGRNAMFARAMAEARGKMKTARTDCALAYGNPKP